MFAAVVREISPLPNRIIRREERIMRRMIIVSLLFLAVCGSATAADYIRIDTDTVYKNQTSEWEFYLLRECPEPERTYGFGNAWRLQGVGNATWSYSHPDGLTKFPDHMTVWNLGGLLFTDAISGTGMTTGWFLTGGAAMPPAGMPIYTTEKFWFSINMTMGDLPPGSTGDGIEIVPGYGYRCPAGAT